MDFVHDALNDECFAGELFATGFDLMSVARCRYPATCADLCDGTAKGWADKKRERTARFFLNIAFFLYLFFIG